MQQFIARLAAHDRHPDHRQLLCIGSAGRIAVKVINHLGDEVMKVFACQADVLI